MDRDKHKISIVTTVQIKFKWGMGERGLSAHRLDGWLALKQRTASTKAGVQKLSIRSDLGLLTETEQANVPAP